MTWKDTQKVFIFALASALSLALAMGCSPRPSVPPTQKTKTTISYFYEVIINANEPKLGSDNLTHVAANPKSVFFASANQVYVRTGPRAWAAPVVNFTGPGATASAGATQIRSLSATNDGAFAAVIQAGNTGVAFIENNGHQPLGTVWKWRKGTAVGDAPDADPTLVYAFTEGTEQRLAVGFSGDPSIAVSTANTAGTTSVDFGDPAFVKNFTVQRFQPSPTLGAPPTLGAATNVLATLTDPSAMLWVPTQGLLIAQGAAVYMVTGYTPGTIVESMHADAATWGEHNESIKALAYYNGQLAIGFEHDDSDAGKLGGFAICTPIAAGGYNCVAKDTLPDRVSVNGMVEYQGKLYMSTAGQGLFSWDGTKLFKFTSAAFTPAGAAAAVGAAGAKAGQPDVPGDNAIEYVTVNQLPSDNLKGVAVSGNTTLWMATDAGAVGLTVDTKKVPVP